MHIYRDPSSFFFLCFDYCPQQVSLAPRIRSVIGYYDHKKKGDQETKEDKDS
jgi:hypothetical protein